MKQTFQAIKDNLVKDYQDQGVKIHFNCGAEKQAKDWIGVDTKYYLGVDLVVKDLEAMPKAFPDECASMIMCPYVVERIPREDGRFLAFMNECWRILKPDGQMMIATPYAASSLFLQDPMNVNGCTEITWAFFDPLEPNSQGLLYKKYTPKPWKIDYSTYQLNGVLECSLIKRRLDKSYL